jgi:hypothetical protein
MELAAFPTTPLLVEVAQRIVVVAEHIAHLP